MTAPLKLLVISVSDDLHADAVSWGLSRLGAEVHRWDTSAFPLQETMCYQAGSSDEWLHFGQHSSGLLAEDIDCVWDRRMQRAEPTADLHPDDQMPAAEQVDIFRRSALSLLGAHFAEAFWVNPPTSDRRAASKMLQLSVARSIGLEIPDTVMTNDIAAVREFFHRHEGRIVFKPLRVMSWAEDDGVHGSYTNKLAWSDLKDTVAFRACPGIFQEHVEKAYEVRATFMGNTCLAVRIDTPRDGDAALDWRIGFVKKGNAPEISPATLPAAVEKQCRALMERLGILFGAFDFIVDPDGQYVFLEVNSAGQFLWVEDNNPACPMLECFCRFLLSRDPEFRWRGPADSALSLAAYRNCNLKP